MKWVAGPIPALESGGASAAEVRTGWAWGDQDAMGNRRTRSHERSRETQGIDGGIRGKVQSGRRRSYSIQEGSFSGSEGVTKGWKNLYQRRYFLRSVEAEFRQVRKMRKRG